ncbi:putative iron-regulated protein [Lutibacter oceani]|uniref:Putative iron-regulated protein n=1 Tax=Lutibacter oceani TaxID=1853311 RepID=A0A3D9RM23_9FLAO|nr:ChaN family lipoprotein [Lutibacter oceani]REE80940.1 putative iron-regulated protein [Lutibacter oceani]
MRKLIVFLLAITFSSSIYSQNKPAYKLYNSKGNKVSYKKMIREMSKTDVVLFGEHHNNPIVHWLQFETTKDLSKLRNLILGAEMFEADNQIQLNDYLAGKINQKAFDTVARLWNNYPTDYKPLVDFAKNENIQFIATNIPRRYASMVFKGGFEALEELSNEEKSWIAPLPIAYDETLPGYVKMKEMMGGHGGDNLPKAQAVKDATMGNFILTNSEQNKLFLHYNGSYHSDDYEGINWYLNKGNSSLKIITVSVVEQDNIKKFNKENKLKADFIIVIPSTMTKTY